MHRYQCGICSQYLSSCSNSPRQLTNVAKNDTHEENLLKLFTLLSTQSSYCFVESETIKRFVCQYTYQPCDDMGSVYLPPRNTCEYLRDNACSSEWRTLANNPVFGSLLPSCDTLEYDTNTNSSATCNETNEGWPYTNYMCKLLLLNLFFISFSHTSYQQHSAYLGGMHCLHW